jgi:hypothetical protein
VVEALRYYPCFYSYSRGLFIPRDQTAVNALFGTAGASGGLYDPPPVGSDEQANQYMVLDLPGQATVLFPFKLDQAPEAFGGTGWVTSLDWTPDTMRYQVDRKVKGGMYRLDVTARNCEGY